MLRLQQSPRASSPMPIRYCRGAKSDKMAHAETRYDNAIAHESPTVKMIQNKIKKETASGQGKVGLDVHAVAVSACKEKPGLQENGES